MALMDVTLTAPTADQQITGILTATWTLPAGKRSDLTYLGVYRQTDRNRAIALDSAVPPFAYYPVVATGFPSLPYGIVPSPLGLPGLAGTFIANGQYPATGILPNGDYTLWLLVLHQDRNTAGEITNTDYGIATQDFSVTGSAAVEPARIPLDSAAGEPPPPTIVSPAEGSTVDLTPTNPGDDPKHLFVEFSTPPELEPQSAKIAIYREENLDRTADSQETPVVYSDRAPYGEPGTRGGAEWVLIEQFERRPNGNYRMTFDGEPGSSGDVPTGNWFVAVRYTSLATGRLREFDPLTGEFRRSSTRYHASQPAEGRFSVTGGIEDTAETRLVNVVPSTRPYITWPRPVIEAEVNTALRLAWQYHNRRGVGQKSVQIRRVLSGGANAGTRYLSRNAQGVLSWVTALSSPATDIPITTTEIELVHGTSPNLAWGGLTWGTHQFDVRPTTQNDVQGAWSTKQRVIVYRRLTLTGMSIGNPNGWLQVSWTHDGDSGNNQQRAFKIAVYADDALEGDFPIYRTSPDPDDRFRRGPARWVQGDNTLFVFSTSEDRASDIVRNGNYIVRMKIRDRRELESNTLQRPQTGSHTVNNPGPPAATIVPRVYNIRGEVQSGSSGLIPGAWIGIGTTLGSGGVAAASARLERRETSRSGGREINDEPIVIADLPLASGAAIAEWPDQTVLAGAEYEYRAVTESRVGGETFGAWTP